MLITVKLYIIKLISLLPWQLLSSFPNMANRILNLVIGYPGLYLSIAKKINIDEKLKIVLRQGVQKGRIFDYMLFDEVHPLIIGGVEPITTQILLQLNIQDSIAIDIGASYGYYTLLFSRLVGENGAVYAFEPDSQFSFPRLHHNITLNKCVNVNALPFAISDMQGMMGWVQHKNEPWLNRIVTDMEGFAKKSSKEQTIIPVITVTLDNFSAFVPKKKIKLIKIDVESGEGDVLKGATNLLSKIRPLLMIELHSIKCQEEVSDILKEHKYIWHVTDNNRSNGQSHIFAFPEEEIETYQPIINKIL
jgi:FkbM family methyltransferase